MRSRESRPWHGYRRNRVHVSKCHSLKWHCVCQAFQQYQSLWIARLRSNPEYPPSLCQQSHRHAKQKHSPASPTLNVALAHAQPRGSLACQSLPQMPRAARKLTRWLLLPGLGRFSCLTPTYQVSSNVLQRLRITHAMTALWYECRTNKVDHFCSILLEATCPHGDDALCGTAFRFSLF